MVIIVTNDRLFGQRIRFELTFRGVFSMIVSGHDVTDLSGNDAPCLSGRGVTDLSGQGYPDLKSVNPGDALVIDVRSGVLPERYEKNFSRFARVILLSDKEENVPGTLTLCFPLPLWKLADVLRCDAPSLRLSENENDPYAVLNGKQIPLSATEYALLKILFKADGAYVARDVLLRETFGDGASQSALNVYIHYLREKLENDEKRLIFSSRKQGYALILPERRTPC